MVVGMRQGYLNETGNISMRQGAPCLYRDFWFWSWVGVFGILYFGGLSKYRNKYRTDSIRATWWDYGRKGGSEIVNETGRRLRLRQGKVSDSDHSSQNSIKPTEF